jgi:hypothetical protein
MSEAKYTPGPWFISPDGIIYSGKTPATALELAFVAQGSDGIQEAQANGMLMAAAPDLLSALKSARRYVVGAYECAFPNESENTEVLADIDLAIAKAEGQPQDPRAS